MRALRVSAGTRGPKDPRPGTIELDQREEDRMASSGKKKTTMAKLTRERKLHERRLDKQAKKDARKRAPAHPPVHISDDVSSDVPEGGLAGTPTESSM